MLLEHCRRLNWPSLGMAKKKKAAQDPAFEAADTEDVAALTELLDAGDAAAICGSRNREGWTPLIQSAFAGSAECLALLLARGSDVAAKCKDGCLAVHYASAQGHVDCVKALLIAGGLKTLSLADNDGETALDVALNAKTKRAIEKLAEELAADAEGDDEEGADGDDADDAEKKGGSK